MPSTRPKSMGNPRRKTKPASTATLALRACLESLPQELYDEIYTLTFTADNHKRQINASYRPPAVLHVDRASREMFSKSYFDNGAIFCVASERILSKWLLAFEKQIVEKVETIQSPYKFPRHFDFHDLDEHDKAEERKHFAFLTVNGAVGDWHCCEHAFCHRHRELDRMIDVVAKKVQVQLIDYDEWRESM